MESGEGKLLPAGTDDWRHRLAEMDVITGILITVGENPLEDHTHAGAFFVQRRGLKETLQEQADGLCISTFSRNEPGGNAHAPREYPAVWVLGSLIYRGSTGFKAVTRFREDLEKSSLEHMAKVCDGQFCMVIRDRKGFVIITDYAGIMNMYLYRSGSTLAISSSSMALSRHYPVTPNPQGIAQFLRSANVYGSGTIYGEISVLAPASLYSFERVPGGFSETRKIYWQPPTIIHEGMGFEESRDSLLSTMLESFGALPKDSLICDLTAGFDSRLILSILSAFRSFQDIHVFVFGPPGSREVCLVKDYCRTLGLVKDHLALPPDWDERVWEYVDRALSITDGEENVFVYAPILWAQDHKAKTHSFSVNGLGGELYRDFWWIQELFPSKRPANLDRLIDTRVLQYEYDYMIFSDRWRGRMSGIRDIFKAEFLSSIADMDPGDTYNTLQVDNLYLRQKMRRWAGRTISSSNQVITMLTPLTMKKCVTSVLSIPPGHKRNGRLVKAIIEKLSPQLSGLMMLNGAPCQNITLRNAHRFIPLLGDYGKRGARKLVQKMMNRTIMLDRSISYQQACFFDALFKQGAFKTVFSHDELLTKGLYQPDAYARFYEEAAAGRSLYYHQLGNILTLEMRMRADNIKGYIV